MWPSARYDLLICHPRPSSLTMIPRTDTIIQVVYPVKHVLTWESSFGLCFDDEDDNALILEPFYRCKFSTLTSMHYSISTYSYQSITSIKANWGPLNR